MLVPSKTISVSESLLYKASRLGKNTADNMSLVDLYKENKRDFDDLSEFIDAVDLLYILGKVDVVFETEEVVVA